MILPQRIINEKGTPFIFIYHFPHFSPSSLSKKLIMADSRRLITFSLLVGLALLSAITPSAAAAGDNEVSLYELRRGDVTVKFTNWGATIVSLIYPDRSGKLDDVVLGYESLDTYKNDTTYFGAIVGRVANRIGGAKFTLNGTEYKLDANEGPNMLHGGPKGFSDVIWGIKSHVEDRHITFTYHSYDGEAGFPGAVDVEVTYMFIGSNKLGVSMIAKPLNKATPINLALHAYWNLAGHSSGDILSHTIKLFGSKITPVDDELIPTGKILPIDGSSFDFHDERTIESRFDELPNGYDINYALDGFGGVHLRKVADVGEGRSGRRLELWANQPGVQFYTGNKIVTVDGGKDGAVYKKYAGLCLETQGFPDSVNHPNFPSQIVNPGETYKHVMVYRFTADH